jgi:hypothetical protein
MSMDSGERGASAVGVLIALLGLALMTASVIGWFAFPDPDQQTKVTEVSQVVPTQSRSPDTEVHEASTTEAQPAATPTITTVDKTTTTTNNSPTTEKTTTTDAPKPSRRSEAFFLAMFGTGFVLLLTGSFFDRIQSITGPGNIGVVLKDAGTSTAESLAKLEAAIQKHDSRLDYAYHRISALAKRVSALETHHPEAEALRVEAADAVRVEDEVDVREAEIGSVSADLRDAEAARQELLRHLGKL